MSASRTGIGLDLAAARICAGYAHGLKNEGRGNENQEGMPVMRNCEVYASKIDVWLMTVVSGIGIALAGGTAWQIREEGLAHVASCILLLSLLFYLVVVFALAYPVSYEIRAPYLIIRAGWTRVRISLSSIVVVGPTRDPSSAPALSVDRLRIDYRESGRSVSKIVSPLDKAGFLAGLARVTNGLELQGDRLAKAGEDDEDR